MVGQGRQHRGLGLPPLPKVKGSSTATAGSGREIGKNSLGDSLERLSRQWPVL